MAETKIWSSEFVKTNEYCESNEETCHFDENIKINVYSLSHCRTILLEMFDDKNCHDMVLISGVDEKR